MAKTILVVDDDPNIRDTAKDILEDAGYTILTAESCAEALQALAASSVDVAIVDFNLPDGHGADLAVRAKEIQPKLAVLLLTGESHVNLGPAQTVIYSVLTKPVDPTALIQILRKIVDS